MILESVQNTVQTISNLGSILAHIPYYLRAKSLATWISRENLDCRVLDQLNLPDYQEKLPFQPGIVNFTDGLETYEPAYPYNRINSLSYGAPLLLLQADVKVESANEVISRHRYLQTVTPTTFRFAIDLVHPTGFVLLASQIDNGVLENLVIPVESGKFLLTALRKSIPGANGSLIGESNI